MVQSVAHITGYEALMKPTHVAILNCFDLTL